MKNLTITLDEGTLSQVRREAARQNLSVSRFVSELLRSRLRESRQYELAMRRWLALKPVRLRDDNKPYPKREELYDRPRLR